MTDAPPRMSAHEEVFWIETLTASDRYMGMPWGSPERAAAQAEDAFTLRRMLGEPLEEIDRLLALTSLLNHPERLRELLQEVLDVRILKARGNPDDIDAALAEAPVRAS